MLVFSTSWVYVEVWLLPLSSVPTQSRSFLDRAGVVGLDMGVLTLFASPRGMGVLTLPVSWTQLEVGLMACTSSSPQGRELLFFPGWHETKGWRPCYSWRENTHHVSTGGASTFTSWVGSSGPVPTAPRQYRAQEEQGRFSIQVILN